MDRNEAIEIVRKNWPNGRHQLSEALEILVPELKEPEDERIRKEIIGHFEKHLECSEEYGKDVLRSWIAWLEKQGEKTNPYSGVSFEYNGNIWGMCAREGGVDILCDSQLIKHIEMQGEQKPADWTEEDEANMYAVWKACGIVYGVPYQSVLGDWLKSLKPRWKPTEENIKDLEWCAELFKEKMGIGFHRLQVFIDELKNI